MPASFCHLAVHIIFSSKNRKTRLKNPLLKKCMPIFMALLSI